MYRRYALLILAISFLLAAPGIKAQHNAAHKKETPPEIKNAASNLEKALRENNDLNIANNYEILAQEFADKDDFSKAKEYLIKALNIYTYSKNASGMARVIRNMAKIQEQQNLWTAAAKNYKTASETSTDSIFRKINLNDYLRIKNLNNSNEQIKYLDENIVLLKDKKQRREIADSYIKLALLNLKIKDSLNALEQYRMALPYTSNNDGKTIKIYSEIAKLYTAGKRYEEAILIVKEILAKAKKTKNVDEEIKQQRYLASIYFEIGDNENAVNALENSYKKASASGKTFEARESLILLTQYYKTAGDDKAVIDVYEKFIKNLDRIILSDKSLTDAKTFKVTEERIRTLENEKKLKDELISRKNSFNYFLIGSMALLLLLLGFIAKALRSITLKNKEIALQSLRLEMNPHFIFNSLNSVNQFIAQNNELEANKFLTSYSQLMRNAMENSNKDFVTVGNEIENLTKYLELEHLRFKDKFSFEIIVDEKLDVDSISIPNMIIQPHLENAIWHGLRYKENKGLLKLSFLLKGDKIQIIVDDNGIGPTKSNELKTHNQKTHQSRGLNNTKERMTILNQLYKTEMNFVVTEKQAPETGTIVTVTVPVINKPE